MLEDRIKRLEDLALTGADANKEIWGQLVSQLKSNNARYIVNKYVMQNIISSFGPSFMDGMQKKLDVITQLSPSQSGINPELKGAIDLEIKDWQTWLSASIEEATK